MSLDVSRNFAALPFVPLLKPSPPLTGITLTTDSLDLLNLYASYIKNNYVKVYHLTFFVSSEVFNFIKDRSFIEKNIVAEREGDLMFNYLGKSSNMSISVVDSGTDFHSQSPSLYTNSIVKILAVNSETLYKRVVFFNKFISQDFFESFWVLFLGSSTPFSDFMETYKKL